MDRKRSISFFFLFSAVVLYAATGCGTTRNPEPRTPEPSQPPSGAQPDGESRRTAQVTNEDPNVYFRVKWDGRYIAGEVTVRGLVRKANVVTHRSGGETNAVTASPSTTDYMPITLFREPGLDNAFDRWAERVFTAEVDLGSQMALANYRKDIVIELYDESDSRIAAYRAYRCWPSEHAPAARPEDMGQESREWLVLRCDSWERRETNE